MSKSCNIVLMLCFDFCYELFICYFCLVMIFQPNLVYPDTLCPTLRLDMMSRALDCIFQASYH